MTTPAGYGGSWRSSSVSASMASRPRRPAGTRPRRSTRSIASAAIAARSPAAAARPNPSLNRPRIKARGNPRPSPGRHLPRRPGDARRLPCPSAGARAPASEPTRAVRRSCRPLRAPGLRETRRWWEKSSAQCPAPCGAPWYPAAHPALPSPSAGESTSRRSPPGSAEIVSKLLDRSLVDGHARAPSPLVAGAGLPNEEITPRLRPRIAGPAHPLAACLPCGGAMLIAGILTRTPLALS